MKEDKQLTKEEILQIPELVKTNTLKEIADKFQVHESTIKNWVYKLRKNGYRVPTKKGKRGILEQLENNQ